MVWATVVIRPGWRLSLSYFTKLWYLVSDFIIRKLETEMKLWLLRYFELTKKEIKIEHPIQIIHKVID